MTPKLNTPNHMVTKPIDAMTCCVKVLVPDALTHTLENIYPKALDIARQMLLKRNLRSSKDWKELPCVITKSLIAKYQRNKKCKAIKSLVIPICGDKGKQVKLVDGGIRIPALFKKQIIPVQFSHPIEGFVRQVEFFKRNKQWFCSVCYNTPCKPVFDISGVVGVDRNSVGNIATLADPQNGKVLKIGLSPAPTKQVFRNRRKNLQKANRKELLKKIRNKQSRRMTYENHHASKTIVNYAVAHRRAIVLEDLGSVRKKGSKIKRYSEKNQWAFAQLETFIKYKAALYGIPVYYINPAYTSQTCSRCGSIHKPSGKQFKCLTCGHNDHRDANAAFNIAMFSSGSLSVLPLGTIGGALTGKVLSNVR
jgi:putative transposase